MKSLQQTTITSALFVAAIACLSAHTLTSCDAFTTSPLLHYHPLLSSPTTAFAALKQQGQQQRRPAKHHFQARQQQQQQQYAAATRLYNQADDNEDEIERLKSMAAKLRAEAASLEAQQSQAMADAAERVFRKFDTNQDGQISLEELKAGLEKAFKTDLSEKRVRQLMEDFDKTGDPTSLTKEEFVTVEQFRNRLDALQREEKEVARQAALEAKREEEAAQFVQATLDLINDRPPTGTEKIISVLPYLFPLLDGLQFGRFLFVENPDNALSIIAGVTYALYRSIPFGGFIAFFALNFLSGNPRINRLIRFNMQQAIYLDIALFFPGLLAAVYRLTGGGLPPAATEIGSDVLFFTLLAAVGYSTVSSLLGITPNKLPLISGAVESRMPTVDMFDSEGRFNPNRRDEDKDKDNKDKKE